MEIEFTSYSLTSKAKQLEEEDDEQGPREGKNLEGFELICVVKFKSEKILQKEKENIVEEEQTTAVQNEQEESLRTFVTKEE